MLWLTGCAMAGSDARAPCPPVVEYTSAEQARAADEVEALPQGAVIVRMLADYVVLRDQARACRCKLFQTAERMRLRLLRGFGFRWNEKFKDFAMMNERIHLRRRMRPLVSMAGHRPLGR